MSMPPISYSCSNFSFESRQSEARAGVDSTPLAAQDIGEFLAPFEATQLFNIQAPEEASLFLIGESHDDERDSEMQRDLIYFLASQGPVIVLREGIESGTILDSAEFIDPPYCHNISIMGWDAPEGVFKSSGYTSGELEVLDEKIDKNTKKVTELLNAIVKKIFEFIEIRIAMGYNLSPAKMLHKCTRIINAKKITDVPILESIGLFLNLYERISTDRIELEEGKKHRWTQLTLDKTYPERTVAMVSSVQQLCRENATVVLIAGVHHLKTLQHEQKNPNQDLSSLYEELRSGGHRAAILISPHALAYQEKCVQAYLAKMPAHDEEKE